MQTLLSEIPYKSFIDISHKKNTHSVTEKLPCSNCDKTFKHKDKLKKHNKEQHENTGRIFHCLHCKYSAKRRETLKIHTLGVCFDVISDMRGYSRGKVAFGAFLSQTAKEKMV